MPINKIRKDIDSLDSKIVDLLNKRAQKILEIGKLKNRLKRSIYAPAREKEILGKIARENKGPLNNESLTAIYREVMSASLNLEKPIVIAYMGPKASFSNLAALKKFGASVAYLSCNNISDVFLEVSSCSLCSFGVSSSAPFVGFLAPLSLLGGTRGSGVKGERWSLLSMIA